MNSFFEFLGGLDIVSLTILVFGVLLILNVLPNTVKRMGLVKLGPLEIEHQHQTQNYEINRKIEDIDIENRENLWDMTEELFSVAAENSHITCEAAVGHILSLVASPIRTLVLLNHIAPKLVKNNEEVLRCKVKRGIARGVRDAKSSFSLTSCPILSEIQDIKTTKYDSLIDSWIENARIVTIQSCEAKIGVYESALETMTDKHWKGIYKECIEKNKSYIRGME